MEDLISWGGHNSTMKNLVKGSPKNAMTLKKVTSVSFIFLGYWLLAKC